MMSTTHDSDVVIKTQDDSVFVSHGDIPERENHFEIYSLFFIYLEIRKQTPEENAS